MVFNVLANNRDDHVKNFAFMIDEYKEWTLTPAYDLICSRGTGGEHSMSLAGEGRAPGRKEILKLGHKSGLSKNKINDCLEKVTAAIEKWSYYADIAGVTEQTKDYIQNRIERDG